MLKCEYQRKGKKRVGSVDDFISGCRGGGGFLLLFLSFFWYGESDEKDGKEEEEKIMKERGGEVEQRV